MIFLQILTVAFLITSFIGFIIIALFYMTKYMQQHTTEVVNTFILTFVFVPGFMSIVCAMACIALK